MFILSVAILSFLFILQLFFRPILKKWINWFVAAAVILALGMGTYYSILQYSVWSSAELSKYFLPPFQPITYFLRYSAFRFFMPSVVSFVFAGLFYSIARIINKRSGERFFEREEIGLAAIALFISGFPGIIFVFGFIIAVYLLVHLINLALKRKIEIVPVYYLWLPSSLFAIILTTTWLSKLNLWSLLKIS